MHLSFSPVGWTVWYAWSSCTLSCGTAVQTRTRNCQNPKASDLNDSCVGDSNAFRTCSNKTCKKYIFANLKMKWYIVTYGGKWTCLKKYILLFLHVFVFLGHSGFLARNFLPINGTSDITFADVLYNDRGDYNPSTGVFTCRISGTYWMYASIGHDPAFTKYNYCDIRVNGIVTISMFIPDSNGNNEAYDTASGSGAFHLNINDRVQVGTCGNPQNIFDQYNTHFSGVIIRPDA